MFNNQVYISSSRIKTFNDCKYKFYLTYIIKKQPSDETPSFVFGPGNVVHKLAQTYSLTKNNQSESTKKDEILSWMKSFKLEEKYYETILEQYNNVIKYLTPFLEDLNAGKSTVVMENKINLPWFNKYRFYGFIDLKVVYNDGTIIITDYKSSKEKSDHTTQLGIYAYCTAKSMKAKLQNIKTHVFYTRFNEIEERIFKKQEVFDVLSHVSDVIEQSEKETKWTKQANQYCGFCPYYSYCTSE